MGYQPVIGRAVQYSFWRSHLRARAGEQTRRAVAALLGVVVPLFTAKGQDTSPDRYRPPLRVSLSLTGGRAQPVSDLGEVVRWGTLVEATLGVSRLASVVGVRAVGSFAHYGGREAGTTLRAWAEGLDLVAPVRRQPFGWALEIFSGAMAVHSAMSIEAAEDGKERGPTRTTAALSGGIGGRWPQPLGRGLNLYTQGRVTWAVGRSELPVRYVSLLAGLSSR